MADTPVLQLVGLNKSFSGVQVLKDVSITLPRRGAILGLVGENGAGKSTMMNILGGVLQRDSGEILLEGEPYNPKNANDADRAGIALIHQELNLFLNMTIAENLYLGGAPGSTMGFLSYRTMHREAQKELRHVGIDFNPGTLVENLSMGMRQMVEIAKALSKNARIVVFDEPTTSLSNKEKRHLFSIIRELSAKGISMIYISHTLDDVLELCDEVAVIRDGSIIGQSPIGEMDKAGMISMMVGRKIDHLFPYVDKRPGEVALRVEGLSAPKAFREVSFALRSGEILGLFGLMGAGRSELARGIYGVDPLESGRIYFKEHPVRHPGPEWWIEHGMAYITENRREEGLLMPKSVKENLVLATLRNLRRHFGAVDTRREERESEAVIQRLSIKTYDKTRQTARMLSGGNQQKVVIGKWLMTRPEVFIVDEPTRGVDVGAKFEIYNHLNAMAQEGSAILFISSEMEELIGVCDRIMVMCAGTITGELERKDFDQERLLTLAIRSIKHEHFAVE
ncbi:MAG: sugar ABC transporter ATP-binding protein [Spirochaetales bacterium]|nr:sugar ABC transporter ATP-binding protein [Spirochaetales bacterium]